MCSGKLPDSRAGYTPNSVVLLEDLVQFPAPTWRLKTSVTPVLRDSTPSSKHRTRGAHTYKIPMHIKLIIITTIIGQIFKLK